MVKRAALGGCARSPSSTPERRLYRRLLRQIIPYRRIFAAAVLCTLLLGGIEPLIAALVEPLLDGSFVARDPFYIAVMPVALAGLFLLRGGLGFAAGVGLKWLANQVVMDLRQEMFNRLLTLPTHRFQRLGNGPLLSKFTYDVAQVTQAATQALIVLGRDSVAVVGLIGYMLWLNAQLAAVMLTMTPLVAWIIAIASRRLRRTSRLLQGQMGQLNLIIDEAIVGQRVVKAYGGQAQEQRRFQAVNRRVRQNQVKLAVAAEASAPLVQCVTVIALAVVIYFASQQAAAGQMSVGEFGSLFAAMSLLLGPIKRLTRINEVVQRGLAAAESVYGLIDEAAEADAGERELPTVRGEVKLHGVHFGYEAHEEYGGKPVLRGVDLTLTAGATTAIVGASGCGKSTLAHLLLRFEEPTAGQITLDGNNICQLSLRELRRLVGYVGQELVLFNDTIAMNIAYGVEGEVDQERLYGAAEAAQALAFIQRLDAGMATRVGSSGISLSTGQRQRLCLARALYRNPPLLILDEATSALDLQTERRLQQALVGWRQDKTTLVIAHRLSTIEAADCIYVLHEGQVVERGRHRELLAQNGIYAGLYRLQRS